MKINLNHITNFPKHEMELQFINMDLQIIRRIISGETHLEIFMIETEIDNFIHEQ